jgi:uncharacterized repeat protein (TIGR01451 family)
LTPDELFLPDGPEDPDGGIWYDADTAPASVFTTNNAVYRLVVKNCGTVDLQRVLLEDVIPSSTDPETIAFSGDVGPLAVGQTKIVVPSQVNPNIAILDEVDVQIGTEFNPNFEGLNAPLRCQDEDNDTITGDDGRYLNTARVTADDLDTVENPAWVECPRKPCVELKKQVTSRALASLTQDELFLPDGPEDPDGGIWYDADTAPASVFTPNNAVYRLVVKNCGTVDLQRVLLEDVMPSSTNPPAETIAFGGDVGPLAVGQTKIVVPSQVDPNIAILDEVDVQIGTEFSPNFEGLNAPLRCQDEDNDTITGDDGRYLNTARVTADDLDTVENPAWVECPRVPCVELKKQVTSRALASLTQDELFLPDGPEDPDGGIWYDADTAPASVFTTNNAVYRLVVENCGNVDLKSVLLEDVMPSSTNPPAETISFGGDVGPLAVGQTKIVVPSQVDPNIALYEEDILQLPLQFNPNFSGLNAPLRCQDVDNDDLTGDDGRYLNTARVTADDLEPVENPAWVSCCRLEIIKEVSAEVTCIDDGTDTGTDTGTDNGDDECICPCEDGNGGTDSGTDVPPVLECIANKVKFTYAVTNTGSAPLENVEVLDDHGTPNDPTDDFMPTFIGGDDDNIGFLDPGEVWLYESDEVCRCEGINTVTVTGDLPNGDICTAMDDAEIVTDLQCIDDGTDTGFVEAVTGADTLDLGDNKKVKLKITNNTPADVFLTWMTITWPDAAEEHDQLKKCALAGDFAKDVFDPDSPTVLPDEKPFEDDPNKRKLKPGETKDFFCEFVNEFDDKSLRSEADFDFTLVFDNGDVVTSP